MVVFVFKLGQFSTNFEYKIDYNSKNEYHINWKIDFSLVSVHCASSIKMGPFLRERGEGGVGRGGLHILMMGKT